MNVVEAVQVPYQAEPGEMDRVARWCHGRVQVTGDPGVVFSVGGDVVHAALGWWIIRGNDGFTVMTPGRFGALHDEVTG